MNDELTPIEEQVLEAMLTEALGAKGPPDLTDPILGRLGETEVSVGSIVRGEELKRQPKRDPIEKRIAVILTVVATLAASILLMIWLRSDREFVGPSQSIAATSVDANATDNLDSLSDPSDLDGASSRIDSSQPKLADTTPRKPPRGIPLVMESPINQTERLDSPRLTDPQAAPESTQVEAVTLVSKRVDSELHHYWNAIGIKPSDDAATEETIKRLVNVLGVELSADLLDDPQRLQKELAHPTAARAIAQRWLRQISEGGVTRLDQRTRNALTEDLATCFEAERGFDKTLASWIGGQSPHTSSFYQAISSDHSALARRLAALTMNIDLRCTRCHESYIEGNGRQQDFWSFSAFLNRGIARGPRGQVSIDAPTRESKEYFYQLPDGRQRVVEVVIPSTWMASPSNQPVAGVGDWAKRLIGSPELAHGVVNSLWQLVHGQPLRGRVVDPFSAPHDESLDQLEDDLVRDLIRSRFDVARTLALIIVSPATKRAVPEPLRPENSLVADRSVVRKAEDAVNAFAAAMPLGTDLPIRLRIDMAMRAVGGKLGADGRAVVAQIDSGSDKTNRTRSDRSLSDDFPDRSDSYPVQWLTQIKDHSSRVEHLAYLAGYSQVPSGVMEAAEATRAAKVSDELTLQRVWWLLRQ